MSKGNKQYNRIEQQHVPLHDYKKHGNPVIVTVHTLDMFEFKQVHGSRWKTVAHRMRTWYAAKFKQAHKDRDLGTAYRMMDRHNHMLAMIQAG